MKKVTCDICKSEIKSKPHELKDEFSQKAIKDVCVDCVNYMDKRLEVYDAKVKKERIDLVKKCIENLTPLNK